MRSAMRFCSFAFLFFAVSFARAQSLSVVEDSVIIRDNRMQLPFQLQNRNISILTQKEIKQLPVKSVNELLAYVAGVDMRQRGPWGAQADVSIDGSTFDQVLVLINGVKISDPQTGHNMMNLSLPLGAIDHIEVLRGPAARVYGVNALAGAINIVTVQPKKNEVFAQAYAGSSFQNDTSSGNTFSGWGAQAAASLVSGASVHTLALAHDEGNGYRYNTAYKANKIFYQNKTTLSTRSSLEAFGIYSRNKFGAHGFYSAPGDIESQEAVETALGSMAYNYQLTEKIKLTPRISYRYNKDDYIYNRHKPELYRNIHETNTVTGELQSRIKTKNGTIGLGAEWRHEAINSSNLGKRERYNAGFYAEYRRLFLQRLNVSAGVYGNYNSDYGWQFFPGVDAGVRFSNHWKLFAAFTTGQRLPTYTDLYYKGPLNIGNENLKPEQSSYGEAGLEYQQPALRWKASYFYRHANDLIDWVRATDSLPWQPQNFQTVNTSGWTTQIDWHLNNYLNLSSDYALNFNLSYTYLNQEIRTAEKTLSKYSIEALRHQLTGRLNAMLFKKLGINITGRYQQRINFNDYTIVDIRLSYRLKSVQAYVGLNNIFDTQYKEIGTIQMPGRWFTAGLRMNISQR